MKNHCKNPVVYIYIYLISSQFMYEMYEKVPLTSLHACNETFIIFIVKLSLSLSLSIYLSITQSLRDRADSFAVNFMLDIRTRSIITGCDKLHRRLLGEVSFGCSGGHFEVSVLKTLHNTSRVKLLSRVKSGGDK